MNANLSNVHPVGQIGRSTSKGCLRVGVANAFFILFFLLMAPKMAHAQAPASLAGNSFGVGVTAGIYPFASTGYFLLLPATTGATYKVIGIYDVENSSGTYSYSSSGANGTANLHDSVGGLLNADFTFSTPSSGSYEVTNAAYFAYQDADFEMFSGQVPSSIAGKSVQCTVQTGLYPFATTGSSILQIANSGNTYTIIGDGINTANSSGTYSYSKINSTTGAIAIHDSTFGSATAYLAFSSTNAGGYAIAAPLGFQIGYFTTTEAGSLHVTISPTAAITDGAQWQLDDGALLDSGATVNNLPVGKHTVSFTTLPGWTTPASRTVSVSANSTTTMSGTYVPQPGDLSVTISPAAAITAGAEWRVNGGAYQASGATVVNLSPTTVTVSFKRTPGFATPANQTATITSGQTTTLVANYVDTNEPTLSIVSPATGQDMTNAAFTVTGTAGDNVAVAAVYYQLDGGDWIIVSNTSNSWTNWAADVTLTLGLNTVCACAVDTSGNISPISTVNFYYILTAPLVVQTNGRGTVSPNYNNQSLVIGSNYSMTATATPGSGFAFTNWTGGTNPPFGVMTNKPKLNFQMASNLTLVANFVDTNPPSLTITSPTKNQRWSNSAFTVTGTATDNVAASNVFYSLNSGGWSNAVTGNHWTNWTATETLAPGPNTNAVYAVDTSGNKSPTTKVVFLYIPSATLTVQTNGFGGITPADNGKLLAIGTNYTLTAWPGKNWLFSNWVGGTIFPYAVLSTTSNYTFRMQSNLVIEANFATNLFLAAQGNYYGLFAPADPPRQQTNSGSFTLTVGSNGVSTGKLYLAAETNSLSGKFDVGGYAQVVSTPHGQKPLTTTLQLDLADQSVQGTVTDGSFVAILNGDQAVFNSAHKATNYQGRYTLVIPGVSDSTIGPFGTSYGTVTVDASGNIAFVGSLADGTPVSQSSGVSKDGHWPFYVPLYSGAGSLWGTNNLTNQTIVSAPTLSWINATNSAKTAVYRSGFTNQEAALIGSFYTSTNKPLLSLTNFQVRLEAVNPPISITNQISWASNNTITVPRLLENTNGLTLTNAAATGTISGGFLNPTNARQTIKLNGVLMQDRTNAAGYFLGPNQSGALFIAP